MYVAYLNCHKSSQTINKYGRALNLHTERERERERSSFVNPVLSTLTQVAGFTSCFSTVRKRITPLHSVNSILPFQYNLIDMLLHLSLPHHIRPPTPSSSRHFKIQRSSQNITIIPSQNTPVPSHSTRTG